MKRSARLCAFTLVELLVVMAIISLLAAMLLPTLQRARFVANIGNCSSNHKQLYTAVTLYAGDFNDLLPETDAADYFRAAYLFGHPGWRWYGLGLLLKTRILDPNDRVLLCPDYTPAEENTTDIFAGRRWHLPEWYQQNEDYLKGVGSATTINGPYSFNSLPYYDSPANGKMGRPGRNAGWHDFYGGVDQVTSLIMCTSSLDSWPGHPDRRMGGNAHRTEGMNCSFYDGHVRYIATPPDLWNIYRVSQPQGVPISGASLTWIYADFWAYATYKDR